MSRSAIVLPILPADDIRTAVANNDWTRASALVAGHDATVRAAFVDPPREDARAAMTDLLAHQQALMLELQQHVAERLAAFKVPVQVWFFDEELPRNPAGKVLKRELREQVLGA